MTSAPEARRPPTGRLCLLLLLVSGSTVLGSYYYRVYRPPLDVAAAFMNAMEDGDRSALRDLVRISPARDGADLRPPREDELTRLLGETFDRGRILDQRKREGPLQAFHYLVYREPDGQIYALVVAERGSAYHIVIPEDPSSSRHWYLWDYVWTN